MSSLEAVNNKIQLLHRQAYGYRNPDFFRLKLYSLHQTRYALVARDALANWVAGIIFPTTTHSQTHEYGVELVLQGLFFTRIGCHSSFIARCVE